MLETNQKHADTLHFIHDRLIHTHNENYYDDYMWSLRDIISHFEHQIHMEKLEEVIYGK